MSVETHRVLIGACGWKHSAWLDNFYEDDLPEDWQLGFYSNEFPVVYVAASDWVDITNMEEWVEDVSDGFRFILEIPAASLNDDVYFTSLLTRIDRLGEHCLGIVLSLNPSICNDSPLLNARLTQAKAISSVCIEHTDSILSDDCKALLIEKNVSEVWNGEADVAFAIATDNLVITHVSGEHLDMRALRKIIETGLQASHNECISVLCIDGKPPSLEVLRNADILLNLL